MKQRCEVSGQEFTLDDAELAFYEKMNVPPPRLCPEERQRRRIAFRNFRSLYQRNCDATGKRLISMYHEEQPFPVYDSDYWWSDHWDPMSYGRDFDFSRPFFEQYHDLNMEVPRQAVTVAGCENCGYCNLALSSKDCYLVFGCVNNRDCLYGHIVWNSENCLDNLYVYRCEWCSNCIDAFDCYDVHYSFEVTNCQESYFLYDCSNCKNCFGCNNLRNKQFYFLNQKCSKEEYAAKLLKVFPLTQERISRMYAELKSRRKGNLIVPRMFGLKNENVTGNHIYESHDVQYSFDVKQTEHAKYCYTVLEVENSYDCSFGGNGTKFCLDCLTPSGSQEIYYSHTILGSHRVFYSDLCFSSNNLFGCSGVRNKHHCVLNKQYTKEDYTKLEARIIDHMKSTGEWGYFFPMKNSPFAYNEAIVNEYHPLSREEAVGMGARWKEESVAEQPEVQFATLPQTIGEITEDISKAIFSCEKTKKAYRITPKELSFYRRMKLPLPRYCPDARHDERMSERRSRKLWQTTCINCQENITSAYDPAVFAKIYCDECYLKALY